MKGKNLFSLLWFVISLFFCLFLLVKMVPGYVLIFKSFGGQIPVITQIIVSISEFVKRFFMLLAPVIFLGLLFYSIYVFSEREKTHLYIINIVLTVFFLLASFIIYQGMELSLKKLSRIKGESLNLPQTQKRIEAQ
ncbi:hypothetical protein KAU39_04835 [bacterium]|nr:hypothetical protein [bacterium]